MRCMPLGEGIPVYSPSNTSVRHAMGTPPLKRESTVSAPWDCGEPRGLPMSPGLVERAIRGGDNGDDSLSSVYL